mgnify:CR=1 FL=1
MRTIKTILLALFLFVPLAGSATEYKNAFKVTFLSWATGSTKVSYERAFNPHQSGEICASLIGAGYDKFQNNPLGYTLRYGHKFFLAGNEEGGLKGFYVRPEFIYANYKTEQEKIKQVHDYLTFVIVEFFCVLVIFEDVIFWILGNEYAQGITVFPIMVLVPVFLIISETTVYGISIAKKPIFDTIGIGLSVVANILFCFLLAPKYQLYGVCLALCLSNLVMFVFRTVIAQKLYCSIPSYMRTTVVCCLLFVITFFGTIWADNFALKAVAGVIGMAVYVVIYRRQLASALTLGKEVLGKYLKK